VTAQHAAAHASVIRRTGRTPAA